jgi:outer membrane protein OmpA-like peptidoglycan-associated protein
MKAMAWMGLIATGALAGCQTSGGVHEVPVARDYQEVSYFDLDDAEAMVAKAHRVGAQHHASFEYTAAARYLTLAQESRARRDKRGAWDYARLAYDSAERAVAQGAILPDKGPFQPHADRAACQADFDRVKGRHGELDPEVAMRVAPVLYAHATAELSRAEHDLLNGRHWRRAGQRIALAEEDIDTLWTQDVDADGVLDLNDGAPWAPEDRDEFEDTDGVPDPDNDQDGILDTNDLQPNDLETMNHWHDFDGAPDQPLALDTIYYASGSVVLTTETKGYLRGIIHVLEEWPGLKLHVKGHTDSVAGEPADRDLSRHRAETVRAYLIFRGAPADRVIVSYFGDSMPLNENRTAAEKAANRRVELVLE